MRTKGENRFKASRTVTGAFLPLAGSFPQPTQSCDFINLFPS
jgi:hypothetical protein